MNDPEKKHLRDNIYYVYSQNGATNTIKLWAKVGKDYLPLDALEMMSNGMYSKFRKEVEKIERSK